MGDMLCSIGEVVLRGLRRAALLAALMSITLIGVADGVSAAQPVACTSITARSAPSSADVFVIGDSLSVGDWCVARSAATEYSVRGLVAAVDARQSRFSATGLSIIRGAQAALPLQIVFALGTNDVIGGAPVASFRTTVESVIRIAGLGRRVHLVTVHSSRHTEAAQRYNDEIWGIAARHPNVSVIDWAGVLGDRPALLAPDGVHLSVAGYRARASFIAGEVSGSSSPPPLLDTSTTTIGAPVAMTTLAPTRLADSRRLLGVTRLRSGVAQRVQVAAVSGLPEEITAIAATFTVTETAGSGFLAAYPCGPVPDVSTTNWPASSWTVANSSIVPLDAAGGICLRSIADTEVIVDVTGYFSPAGTERFTPTVPFRAGDTRTDGRPEGQLVTRFEVSGVGSVPVDATAVSVNVAVVTSAAPLFATVFPCGSPVPSTSTVNVMPGVRVQSNNAIVGVGEGAVCVYTSSAADVVVDVTGWFGSEGRLLQAVEPIRVIDTRQADTSLSAGQQGRAVTPGTIVRVAIAGVRGIPEAAEAASINATAVGQWTDGFVAVFPSGVSWPGTSSVNTHAWRPDSNGLQVALGEGGVSVLSSSSGHVIVDLAGVWL